MGKEITKSIEQEEWYNSLIEDCQSILTEGIWNYRLTLIKTYYLLGKRILEDEDKFTKAGYLKDGMSSQVTTSLRMVSQRTIERAIQFTRYVEKELKGNLDLLPGGKNISWHKICNELLPEPKKENIPLPEGKYQVIYADIPWAYDVDLSKGATRSPENNYPVMDLEKIKNFGLRVRELATDDCVLFMWITAPKLNWMGEVLEAFGFEYKTNLIWDKVKPNLGHYSSVRHEILVIAGKGNCAPICDGKTIQSIDSVQSIEKSSRHSEKPLEFMDIIDKLYPDYKKIELFARNKDKRRNWSYWGDQANV